MRFATIFSVLAAGAMAFAGPLPKIVAKRSVQDVENVFAGLSTKCDNIIPQFGSCSDDGCSSGVISQLVGVINDSNTAINSISGGSADDGLADAVAGVITKIANGLDQYKIKGSFGNVDSSLSTCLGTASRVCSGLVSLVSPRVSSSVAALKDIGFSSTLQTLGLN